MEKNKNNTTEFEYQGTVSIELTVNGKSFNITSNNAGSTFLKYAFASAMAGEFNAQKFSPGYLSLYKQASGEGQEILEYTKHKIALTAPQLVDVVNGYPTAVNFTAYLTYDNLQDVVQASDTSKYWFYLFPRTGNQYLASISVSPVSLSYISAGTTATVTWTLRIINHSEY